MPTKQAQVCDGERRRHFSTPPREARFPQSLYLSRRTLKPLYVPERPLAPSKSRPVSWIKEKQLPYPCQLQAKRRKEEGFERVRAAKFCCRRAMQFDAVSVFVCQCVIPIVRRRVSPNCARGLHLTFGKLGVMVVVGSESGRAGVCNVRYDHSVMRMTLV